jgi:hypothetical protein
MTNVPEFERLESHLRASWLVRIVSTCASAWITAGHRSATARVLRRARDRFLDLPEAERVRAAAVFVATAVVGHLVLVSFLPAHIAPALPKSFWIVVVVTALVAALNATRLIEAWRSSVVSRIWRDAGSPPRQ